MVLSSPQWCSMSRQLARVHAQFFRRHNSTLAPRDNFYKLLGVTESFHIDSEHLAERFKHLQRQWHPDKFVSRPRPDREGAADMSARLNEAYSVLRVPYERAKHLLQIRSQHSHRDVHPIDDTELDPEFLMWVVESRENIADAAGDKAKLTELKQHLEQALSVCLDRLSAAFEANQLQIAAKETAKLQYLRRIQQAIEDFSE